jgi:hypothetical protein
MNPTYRVWMIMVLVPVIVSWLSIGVIVGLGYGGLAIMLAVVIMGMTVGAACLGGST